LEFCRGLMLQRCASAVCLRRIGVCVCSSIDQRSRTACIEATRAMYGAVRTRALVSDGGPKTLHGAGNHHHHHWGWLDRSGPRHILAIVSRTYINWKKSEKVCEEALKSSERVSVVLVVRTLHYTT